MPICHDGYADELTSIDENGCVRVPPGLGVGYDGAAAERFRIDEVVIK